MSNELLFYSEELKKQLNPQAPENIVTVQRGLLLYRQDMVYRKVEDPEFIKATVQDVVPCDVVLDLTEPAESSCSCKQGPICRHQLAVFFSSFSAVSSVSEWISTWKNENKGLGKNVIQLQKAKELLQDDPALESSYQSWKEFMHDTFKKQVTYSLFQPSYTLTTKWDAYLQRVKAKMPLESEWRVLYLFITYFQTFLFTMNCLKKQDISNSARHFLEKEAQKLVENLYYIMNQQLTRISRPFAFDDFYKEIRKDMRQLLEEEGSLSHDCLDLYRAIWTTLLKEKTWRKEEYALLNAALEKVKSTDKYGDATRSVTVATLHLSLLTGQDDQVNTLLKEMKPSDYPLLNYWVRSLDDDKSAPFIVFVMNNIQKYLEEATNYYKRKEFVTFFCPFVKRYCFKTKNLDSFEKFCEASLPYSFVYYSNYLLDIGKHKKWVELYIYGKIEFEYISSEEIKIVLNSDPALLLPLFTSIVNEKIENKNRQSYRVAVRYLKKIRSIYKKQKNLEQWERYIDKVQNSNKRLRAFQEELKRGKLIHVE